MLGLRIVIGGAFLEHFITTKMPTKQLQLNVVWAPSNISEDPGRADKMGQLSGNLHDKV